MLSPGLAKTFGKLQELARSNSLPPGILEIEAFVDSEDAKLALNVAFERFPKPAKDLIADFKTALPQLESLLLLDQSKNRFELSGPGYLTHQAGGFSFRVSHLSFFQVNRFLIEELMKSVLEGAKGGYALDLYAGVGFFTLPLAKSFTRVVSVDANLSATRDLRVNAEAAGVQVVSHNEHAEEFLKKEQEQPDFVVLDPPRFGLGAEVAARLANLGAPEIAYLSCDPSTLARDLAVLTASERRPATEVAPAHRYEISQVQLFDLFPADVSHRNSREVAKSHMKLPAVALAASFAGGILLGLQPVVARHATSRYFLALLLVFLLVCLLAAILFTWREKLWFAASCSLAAWIVLGVFAACIAEQPLPPEHVLEPHGRRANQQQGSAALRGTVAE